MQNLNLSYCVLSSNHKTWKETFIICKRRAFASMCCPICIWMWYLVFKHVTGFCKLIYCHISNYKIISNITQITQREYENLPGDQYFLQDNISLWWKVSNIIIHSLACGQEFRFATELLCEYSDDCIKETYEALNRKRLISSTNLT